MADHSDNYNLTKNSWRMPRHVSSIYKVSPFPCSKKWNSFFPCKTFSHCVVQLLIFYTSALCQTIYNNTWWSKCQGHSFKLFSYQMYMIFLLALLPDRNTSPHCWPNIHNRVVFLKLDAKILSKVSSLVGW